MSVPFIAMPGTPELIIILVIVILVFGAAKLPELARGTGQALRIFKAETKGLNDDDNDDPSPADPKVAPELERGEEPAEGEIVEHPRDTNAG